MQTTSVVSLSLGLLFPNRLRMSVLPSWFLLVFFGAMTGKSRKWKTTDWSCFTHSVGSAISEWPLPGHYPLAPDLNIARALLMASPYLHSAFCQVDHGQHCWYWNFIRLETWPCWFMAWIQHVRISIANPQYSVFLRMRLLLLMKLFALGSRNEETNLRLAINRYEDSSKNQVSFQVNWGSFCYTFSMLFALKRYPGECIHHPGIRKY